MPWWAWLLIGLWALGMLGAVAVARAAGAGERQLARRAQTGPGDRLDHIVSQVCAALDVERGALLLRSTTSSEHLVVVAEHGTGGTLHGRQVPTEAAARVLEEAGRTPPVRTAAAAPVIFGGKVRGRLTVGSTDVARHFDERDLALLDALADRCAALVADREAAAPEPVDTPDRTSRARAVASLAGDVATRLGLDSAGRTEIELAASLAGLGELRFWRPGPGSDMPLAGSIARFRAERFDGSGPHGLSRERIPLGSRILAACDVWFDGLHGAGPSAGDDPAPRAQAIAALRRASGSDLDPDVVDALLSVLGERGGRFEVVRDDASPLR